MNCITCDLYLNKGVTQKKKKYYLPKGQGGENGVEGNVSHQLSCGKRESGGWFGKVKGLAGGGRGDGGPSFLRKRLRRSSGPGGGGEVGPAPRMARRQCTEPLRDAPDPLQPATAREGQEESSPGCPSRGARCGTESQPFHFLHLSGHEPSLGLRQEDRRAP